jgi:acyl dehydratase
LARQLYFEAVKVGDELPPLVKPPVDRSQIARFAGATGDYGPLHVDEPFARNAGFPSVLVPGMLTTGFLAELASDWLRGARIRRFSARFVKIVWPGDVVTVRGRVVDRRFEPGGKYAADIEVWGENQRGELVVRGAVTAQLFYSAEDETRQRNGQPPLQVTQAEEEERRARLSRSTAPARPAVGTPRPNVPSKGAPPAKPKAAPVPAPKSVSKAAPKVAKAAAKGAPRSAAKLAPRKAPPKKPVAKKAPPKKPTPRKPAPKKPAPKKPAPRPAKKQGGKRR